MPSHPRHERYSQQREDNPHQPSRPSSATSDSAAPRAMPLCRRIMAARAAMAASAMTAPGGPTTPWKHIQPKQDAAAMNTSRKGSAATRRNRQIAKRGAGSGAWRARSGSAVVVSEWDGRRRIVGPAPARGTILRSRNYSLVVGCYSGSSAAWLSQTKAARRHAGGKGDVLMGRPARREAWRPPTPPPDRPQRG